MADTSDMGHLHPNPDHKAEGTFAAGRPVHGGLNAGELESLGLNPDEVIDFSASINPLGPSAKALEAARDVYLGAYPDPDCLRLREAVGVALGVAPDRILPGNGSTELIHLLARAYLGPESGGDALSPGGGALIFSPTFGEYTAACRIQGVAPVMVHPPDSEIADRPFHWDLAGALESIAVLRPSIVFLCNPNNPTGVYLGADEVARVAGALQGIGILALDEAYVPFVEEPWDSLPLVDMGNVAVLRSMTKDHALTGLRLGYMLATEGIVRRVRGFPVQLERQRPGAGRRDCRHRRYGAGRKRARGGARRQEIPAGNGAFLWGWIAARRWQTSCCCEWATRPDCGGDC